MNRAPPLYFALMAGAGVLFGAVVSASPAVASGRVSPLLGLLAVSLAFELVTALFGAKIGLRPLSMPVRIAGFFSGAVLYLLITAVFRVAAPTA